MYSWEAPSARARRRATGFKRKSLAPAMRDRPTKFRGRHTNQKKKPIWAPKKRSRNRAPAVTPVKPVASNQTDSANEQALETMLDSAAVFDGLFADNELLDAFTLEGVANIGALPHLCQPVPVQYPSPSTRAALPTWTDPPEPNGRLESPTRVLPKKPLWWSSAAPISVSIRQPTQTLPVSANRYKYMLEGALAKRPSHVPTYFHLNKTLNNSSASRTA